MQPKRESFAKRVEKLKEDEKLQNIADGVIFDELGIIESTSHKMDSRLRLLYILQILHECTQEGTGLTTEQIAAILELRGQEESENFKAPSENTILDDVRALTKNECLGYTAHIPERGKVGGVYLENTFFTEAQIRMLITSVQSSKYISEEECVFLEKNLQKLLPQDVRNNIKGDTKIKIAQRKHVEDVDVFKSIELISRAIHSKKRVTFKIFDYNLKGQKVIHNQPVTVSPVSIQYGFENLYLETYGEQDHFKAENNIYRFRLDRILDLEIDEECGLDPLFPTIAEKKLRRSAQKRIRTSFDMLSGPQAFVFLKISEVVVKHIFNKLGYDLQIRFIHTEPSDNEKGEEEWGVALLEVGLSNTFYKFLSGYGGKVKLMKPQPKWYNTRVRWKNLDRNTPTPSPSRLFKDFEKATDGIREYLERAQGVLE